MRIGLVGHRADLAVEVASLASRAGATVLSLGGEEVGWALGGVVPGADLDLILVDAAILVEGLPEHGSPASGSASATSPGTWPHPPPTAVLCRTGEVEQARLAASAMGCAHVIELPLGAPWLVAQLSPSTASGVLGVVGAVGGAGASTVAIACALGAGADCLLVDGDPDSPGLDLPMGIREGAGVRWAGIPESAEPLDPVSLRAALPQVGGISVVTGAGLGPPFGPGAGRLAGVVGVGRLEFGRTVVDAGRAPLPASLLGPGDAVVLVLPATLAGVVAGRRVLQDVNIDHVAVLLRPTGWLPAGEVAEQLGHPVALEIPRLPRAAELADCGDLLSGRTGRALRRLGERVWEQVR